ncbi:MAG: hypothetical protein ACI379_03260 [Nocardioides sp.]|uniref:hypothetical protein n=1 Tax=Nocardioides sp. TaxID=35761 RepID=UPI003EFFFA48
MKRLLAAAITPVLALGLTLSATPAHAAGVSDKDFVSVATVAKSYPALKDGMREITALPNVQAATSCKKSATLKVKAGKSAAYGSTDTSAPIIGVNVAQMKTVKLAKRVVKGNRILSKCKSITEDGVTTTVKPLKAPKLGQERVALTATVEQGGTKVVLDLYTFRQKGRLVEMSVIYFGTTPQRAKSLALAKKVYKTGL